MAAILKIEKLQYLQNRLTDYDEIFAWWQISVLQSLPAVQKIQILKIQEADGRHFENC